MRRKAYCAVRVNALDVDQLIRGKAGLGATVGVDVSKFELRVVCR